MTKNNICEEHYQGRAPIKISRLTAAGKPSEFPPYADINYHNRPRNWVLETHEHTELYQIFIVLSGSVFVECPDQAVQLTCGQVSMMPPRVAHRLYTTEDYTQLGFNIMMDSAADPRHVLAMLRPHMRAHTVVDFSDELDACREVCRLVMENDQRSNALLAAQADVLLLKILSSAVLRGRDSFTEALKKYLQEHLADNLPLEEVAGHFHMSLSHCERMCRRHCGCGVISLYNQLRTDYACYLLRSSFAPIHEIARTVGFTDVAHFSKFFKKRTGLPPSAFRAQN